MTWVWNTRSARWCWPLVLVDMPMSVSPFLIRGGHGHCVSDESVDSYHKVTKLVSWTKIFDPLCRCPRSDCFQPCEVKQPQQRFGDRSTNCRVDTLPNSSVVTHGTSCPQRRRRCPGFAFAGCVLPEVSAAPILYVAKFRLSPLLRLSNELEQEREKKNTTSAKKKSRSDRCHLTVQSSARAGKTTDKKLNKCQLMRSRQGIPRRFCRTYL